MIPRDSTSSNKKQHEPTGSGKQGSGQNASGKREDLASKNQSKTNTVSSFKADDRSGSSPLRKRLNPEAKNCSPFPEL